MFDVGYEVQWLGEDSSHCDLQGCIIVGNGDAPEHYKVTLSMAAFRRIEYFLIEIPSHQMKFIRALTLEEMLVHENPHVRQVALRRA